MSCTFLKQLRRGCDAAQCRLVYIDVTWTLLEQQKIEILYAATKTPKREKYARFSLPFRFKHMRLVSRAKTAGEDNAKPLKAWLS